MAVGKRTTDLPVDEVLFEADDLIVVVDVSENESEQSTLQKIAESIAANTDAFQGYDADLQLIADANNGAVLAATTAVFHTADQTKLDGIEAGADQTNAANVITALDDADIDAVGFPGSTDLFLVKQATTDDLVGLTYANLANALAGGVIIPPDGLPEGGLTGQLLAKIDAVDFNTEWVDPAVYSMAAPTVDTEEDYRVILFSDGRVQAIPAAATAPDSVVTFDSVIRVNSVKLTWTAPAGAASYIVYRDEVELATTSNTTYRDGTVVVGETYDYTVQAVSAYELRSAVSDIETCFIDPALNIAPVVSVLVYPQSAIALGNRAIVRVNALDADGQELALILGTDVGSLIATADPSVWHLEPA